MSLNDPIADLLTRLRNAAQAKHRYADIPHSRAKENIVQILKAQGYVVDVLVREQSKKKQMRVFLKYGPRRTPVLTNLKRISKPSLRNYVTYQKIPRVLQGMGVAIISTSKGVMDGESARAAKVGGELLCLVW